MTIATRSQRQALALRSKAPPWPLTVSASPLLRYGGAVAIVLLSAGLAELLFHLTSDTRLSMVFLAGVLVSAVLLGAGPGYLAAAAAFLIYNFDLVDPRYTLSLGAPEDFVTLLGFLAAATLTGSLTTRIRNDAARARARADTADVLLAATQEFSAASEEEHIRARLAHHLAAAARGEAIVRQGLRMHVTPAETTISRDLILEISALARQGAQHLGNPVSTEGWTLRMLQADGRALGVAAWRTASRQPLRAEQETLLEILADAGAAAIARVRLTAAKTEAETRARTEDQRGRLLGAIHQDMRAPLAAIVASAGSLRRYGDALDAATRAELAATIEEEAGRLDACVADILGATRLQASALVAPFPSKSDEKPAQPRLLRGETGGYRFRAE
jgi:K+-sensing histidine kinase KdpD